MRILMMIWTFEQFSSSSQRALLHHCCCRSIGCAYDLSMVHFQCKFSEYLTPYWRYIDAMLRAVVLWVKALQCSIR